MLLRVPRKADKESMIAKAVGGQAFLMTKFPDFPLISSMKNQQHRI